MEPTHLVGSRQFHCNTPRSSSTRFEVRTLIQGNSQDAPSAKNKPWWMWRIPTTCWMRTWDHGLTKPWPLLAWKHQKNDNFVGPLLHRNYPSGLVALPISSPSSEAWHLRYSSDFGMKLELRWSTWSTDQHKLGWNPWIHFRGFLKMRDPDNSSRFLILFTLSLGAMVFFFMRF